MQEENAGYERRTITSDASGTHAQVETARAVTVNERRGMSTGALAAICLGVVATAALGFFIFVNNSQETVQTSEDANQNSNINRALTAAQSRPPQQVVQAPPQIIQAPPQQVIQAPPQVIIKEVPVPAAQDPNAVAAQAAQSSRIDPATVEAAVERLLLGDTELASSNLNAAFDPEQGKLTLSGSVTAKTLSERATRLAKTAAGVRSVENKIVVFDQ